MSNRPLTAAEQAAYEATVSKLDAYLNNEGPAPTDEEIEAWSAALAKLLPMAGPHFEGTVPAAQAVSGGDTNPATSGRIFIPQPKGGNTEDCHGGPANNS